MQNKQYWFDIDGKQIPNEEAMLSTLLDESILFANDRQYINPDGSISKNKTIVLYLNCNDVFAWGCADAEDVSISDLPVLFKMYDKNPFWGHIQWICLKRNEKPQKPMQDAMKKDNAWLDVFDNLPENQYDQLRQS